MPSHRDRPDLEIGSRFWVVIDRSDSVERDDLTSEGSWDRRATRALIVLGIWISVLSVFELYLQKE
jgi:hypothetical protein